MLAAPWVCRTCARSLRRAGLFQVLRRASTAAVPNTLPPVLLERARKIAAEHDQLSASLATDFDAKTAKRIGEISRVANALKELEAARSSLNELKGLLESDDAELRELAKDDLESTNAQLAGLGHNLSVALTPKHPFAEMPCLLEIRPGPGGTEGRFFADSLVKMYQAYCVNKGYRVKMVKYEASDSEGSKGSEGEIALQEAVLEVEEPGAYAIFRGEAGMHRVQRVPATEKNGRTHTSAVAVWVLPSFPESATEGSENDWDNPESDFYIDPTEVRSETMRARGAGGQHVNKTESAIRLTHMPTGTTVSMQDSRSQQRNRDYAWRLLRSRIAQQRREAREEMARSMRSSVLSQAQITRGDKIRTYNYQQDRCTDHRVGLDVHNLPDVLRGGETLDKVIESVHAWLTERDIQAVIAEEEAAAAAEKKSSKKK
ncbi:putative peptide chain release factor 1, mitochondrial [Diplogelasinospora grovesii]|uniref:Peptide chain release factor 1, mitochondrial n=1 Tax=Diplogelasinospora grovesii TaxID=303347 RepID=A0AAN6NFE4_9PEZI|nr:putative peptide chain release factor 1, mitochondrial [Diplogelasinospora grovesii]